MLMVCSFKYKACHIDSKWYHSKWETKPKFIWDKVLTLNRDGSHFKWSNDCRKRCVHSKLEIAQQIENHQMRNKLVIRENAHHTTTRTLLNRRFNNGKNPSELVYVSCL